MERPKDESFIIFNDAEQRDYSVPGALSVAKAVETAYGMITASRLVYKAGHMLVADAEKADATDETALLNAIDGVTRQQRSDALVGFASGILELCRPEILDGLYPPTAGN